MSLALLATATWYNRHVMSHASRELRRITWRLNDRDITLIEERPLAGFCHALSLEDVQDLLLHLAPNERRGLAYVILHQPTRKADVLRPRWAAYVPEYRRGDVLGPAILIEAIDPAKPLRWTASLTPSDRRELTMLKREGHLVTRRGRFYLISMEPHTVRRTQRRSFLHEMGHHVQYMRNPAAFARLTSTDKESFANRFARRYEHLLRSSGRDIAA